MNIKPLLALSAAALLLATPVIASAESKDVKEAKFLAGRISRDLKNIKKLARKRGVKPALMVAAAKARGLADSDSDGVPDAFENASGSNSCDIDSDDDGINDGDENLGDSNPGDSSSAKIEIKNTISAITETTVTIGDYTFTINDATNYEDASSLNDFQVGDLVEAKGKKIDLTLFLTKIKKEDD